MRCQSACGVSQAIGSDPPFPWVRTTQPNALQRCYTLEGREGVVKMRVARWDESGTFPVIRLPGGAEIWQPRFFRPDRPTPGPSGSFVSLNAEIWSECMNSMAPNRGASSAAVGSDYGGAFILNKQMENTDCWNLMHRLLASGVVTETCAQYYVNDTAGFRFVPCQEF